MLTLHSGALPALSSEIIALVARAAYHAATHETRQRHLEFLFLWLSRAQDGAALPELKLMERPDVQACDRSIHVLMDACEAHRQGRYPDALRLCAEALALASAHL
jgi:hypothetical protein